MDGKATSQILLWRAFFCYVTTLIVQKVCFPKSFKDYIQAVLSCSMAAHYSFRVLYYSSAHQAPHPPGTPSHQAPPPIRCLTQSFPLPTARHCQPHSHLECQNPSVPIQGVFSGRRKGLPSRSAAPTDSQPWTRAEYTPEIRRGSDEGVAPLRVHEAYGAGQPERLSRRRIRLRGESAAEEVGSGWTRGVRQSPQ